MEPTEYGCRYCAAMFLNVQLRKAHEARCQQQEEDKRKREGAIKADPFYGFREEEEDERG